VARGVDLDPHRLALDDVLVLDLAANLGEDRDVVRVPLAEHLAPVDLLAVLDHDDCPVGHVELLQLAPLGVEEKDVKSKREGKVKFVGLNIVTNDEGKRIALSRNGEIQILDSKGRELEKYDVPDGAIMMVEDGQPVNRGQMLCEWDPHNIPILAERGGRIRFEEIIEGDTLRKEREATGAKR